MKSEQTTVGLTYFGKIPSRGDFVRSANNTALINTLDQWLTQTVELMAGDPRWKLVYDAAAPTNFALLGSRNNAALAGHLLASGDSSGRRFPFIAAGSFQTKQPLDFMARSPLALARLWNRFELLSRKAQQATDAAPVLNELAGANVEIEASPAAYEANYTDFLEMQTVGSLETMLVTGGHEVQVRQAVLALGMLLEPLLTQAGARVDKALVLPLPADSLYRPFVATLWMDLVARFLARAEFDVALLIATIANRTQMFIGFSGISPATLQAVFDPAVAAQRTVDLCDSEWADDHAEEDYRLAKLLAYLQQPDLPLRRMVATFNEAFLGA